MRYKPLNGSREVTRNHPEAVVDGNVITSQGPGTSFLACMGVCCSDGRFGPIGFKIIQGRNLNDGESNGRKDLK